MIEFFYLRKCKSEELWSELTKSFTTNKIDASKYYSVERARKKIDELNSSSDFSDVKLEIVSFF